MRVFSRIKIACVVLISLTCFCGCGKSSREKEELLVSIGGTRITVADFNERVANLPERYRQIAQKRKAAYIQELINDTLLYQEALRLGFDRDEEAKKVIEEAKKKILIAKLLNSEIESKIEISEEEIISYYDSNKDRYTMPEIMRASHILLNTAEDAKEVIDEINSGVSFENAARARSLDPTAQKGGDIGFFPKGQLMPEFDQACSRLNVGETSAAVRTSLGYHIIKLTDRRPPAERPLDQVRDEISLRIREVKKRESFNALLEKLKNSTEIKVNEEALSSGEQVQAEASENITK